MIKTYKERGSFARRKRTREKMKASPCEEVVNRFAISFRKNSSQILVNLFNRAANRPIDSRTILESFEKNRLKLQRCKRKTFLIHKETEKPGYSGLKFMSIKCTK